MNDGDVVPDADQVSMWSDVLDEFERLLDEQERHLDVISGRSDLTYVPATYRPPAALPQIPEQARARAHELMLRNNDLIARARRFADASRPRAPKARPPAAASSSYSPTFDERA